LGQVPRISPRDKSLGQAVNVVNLMMWWRKILQNDWVASSHYLGTSPSWWYVCYVQGYLKSHREQVSRVISKKECKRLKGTNKSMHCIIYDGQYVFNCQGFHTRCISMYMCLNGTKLMHTVTVSCIWCFHKFHF
jgi:hypothetical protein